jgi:hypothetical protein
MVWITSLNVGTDLFGVKNIRVRGFFDGLAGVLIQLRFDIKALEVRHASAEKNPDDGFGFGFLSGFSVGVGVLRGDGIENE